MKAITGWESGLLPDEVMAVIDPATPETGCWPWRGPVRGGYGIIRVRVPGTTNARPVQAHRFIWELLLGPIPGRRVDDLTRVSEPVELDHVCRFPLCVNPAHLEPVTKSENLRRRRFGGSE